MKAFDKAQERAAEFATTGQLDAYAAALGGVQSSHRR